MSNQLVKKNPAEGYQNVFPKTFIDAIKDKESGVSLQEILQGFNMYFISYNGSKALTRCKIPTVLRKEGLWITYVLYDHTVVTEWYNSDQIDDNSWGADDNWRIASNNLVGDVSVSADGYWVINGEKTEAKAQGEQGVTPLLRIGANNKLQVSYNAGKGWKDISDYIVPRFRYTRGTTNNTAGIIQISMDLGKTWTNLSNEITNNLRISRYIGINESLPTSGVAEGTVYMKGPYYDEGDTSNANPIYRMWVYAWKDNTLAWQDNGEFTSISAGVVQELGDSETEVISQKVVSDAINTLNSNINDGIIDITAYHSATDSALGVEVLDISNSIIDSAIQHKLIDNYGKVIELEDSFISQPLYFNKGDILSFGARSSGSVATISKTDETASFYNPLVIGAGSGAQVPYQSFIYSIPEDGYYVISWYLKIGKVLLKKYDKGEVIKRYSIFSKLDDEQSHWEHIISEIYINPKYLQSTKNLSVLRYQESLYIIGHLTDGTETWWAKTIPTNKMNNKEAYPIIFTDEGSPDYELKKYDILGYIVFNNVRNFTGSVTSSKNYLNNQKVTKIELCPIISNQIIGNISAINKKLDTFISFFDTYGLNIQNDIIRNSIENYLIDNNGNKIELEGGYISQPRYFEEGNIISFSARGSQYTASLSKTDKDGSYYTPVVVGTGGGAEVPYQDFVYTIISSGYYSFSWYLELGDVIVYNKKADTGQKFNLLSYYDTLVCIGDSLTYSQVSTSKTEYRPAKKIYPNILSSICGNKAETYAHPGYTPKQWWERFKSQLINRNNALYIIYLGTNRGLTNTIDTDCPVTSLENYADTQTGYYGRILKKIYDLGEKAILIKINGVPYAEETNLVIEQFGQRFGFPVVENDYIPDLVYRYYPDGTGYDDLHLNDLGYAYFTNRLIANIADMSDSMKTRLVLVNS